MAPNAVSAYTSVMADYGDVFTPEQRRVHRMLDEDRWAGRSRTPGALRAACLDHLKSNGECNAYDILDALYGKRIGGTVVAFIPGDIQTVLHRLWKEHQLRRRKGRRRSEFGDRRPTYYYRLHETATV